jgi:hypothetical protein
VRKVWPIAVGRNSSMTEAKRGRTERLQIMVAADELAALDDFRFKSRMPSRAAAMRELLRRGFGRHSITSSANVQTLLGLCGLRRLPVSH